MASRFASIDVETANADMSSICQVGVCLFEDDAMVKSWSTLVDPEDEFDAWNVDIHGIDETSVRGAPRWPTAADELYSLLSDGELVVCHTFFDRVAVARAYQKYDLLMPSWKWLDTARVARRVWTQFAHRGYSLANVATHCGIDFRNHDAEEDARAAGMVLCRAISDSGISAEEWIKAVNRPIGGSPAVGIAREGNPLGHLAGELVVFTGTLSVPRKEIAERAAAVGCTVADGVTQATSILVVGQQDLKKLAGHEKSAKHRKAEMLRAEGHAIRIMGEQDFLSLARL